jgi:hypothetical protein
MSQTCLPDFLGPIDPPPSVSGRRRWRFSLRWLMVATALAGLLCGLALREAWRLTIVARYREIAQRHAVLAQAAPYASGLFRGPGGQSLCVEFPSPQRQYHLRLMHKYDEAAAHPWLPIDPDPPEPK